MKDGDKKKIGKTLLGDLYMAVTLKRDRNIVTAKVSLPSVFKQQAWKAL